VVVVHIPLVGFCLKVTELDIDLMREY
jgi:hypothetical protein